MQIRPLAFAVSSSCAGQIARQSAASRSAGHVRRSVYVRMAFGVRAYGVRCTCIRRSVYVHTAFGVRGHRNEIGVPFDARAA